MRQHNDHPTESTGGSQRASLGPVGPVASQANWAVPDVRLVQRLQTAAGNAAVTDLLMHPPTVGLTLQRRPADVGATPALTLKSGWGFLAILATPWDHLQTALRDYASLKDDQYAARAAVLKRLPVLITDWELHHNVGTAALTAEEKAKVAAIVTLRQLIADEKRELAVLAAGVDEATQAVKAGRFKGDPLLEQVMVGALTVGLGNSGLYVTKLQQALADMPYLAVDKVSGTFDADTQAAVKRFQRANALGETGTVDQATMSRLEGGFRGHAVEKQLAQAPKIGPKSSAGQFAWGSAPTQLGVGTRVLGPDEQTAAKEAVKTAQVAGPGGVLPTFVNDVGPGTYESRLQTLVLGLVDRQFNRLARGKAVERTKPDALFDWAHLDAVAAKSKAATDAVFGKFATGPPLAHGVSIHDAWDTKVLELQDVSVQDTSATWRVNKLLTGNADVKALDREHGAIQGRGPEKAIVDRVRTAVIVAKRDKLLEIHKAWPAFASAGVVNIQRFKAATALANRDEMWKLFHTVVHEYLHTLEHSRYRAYQTKLGQQEGSFTLREGVVEYFTHTVLDGVAYDDPLRVAVEGPFHDPLTKHPIPPYGGYAERTSAEKLAGLVGARNVMAAFFLGDVEKIGGKG